MFGDGPSLTSIWVIVLGLGAVGFFLGLLRWWASIPIIFLLAFYALVVLGDLYASDLYPEYLRSKPDFVPSATLAFILGLSLPFLGVVVNIVRRIKQK